MELECKASGSPPPEIFWFTGSGSYEDVSITTRHSSDVTRPRGKKRLLIFNVLFVIVGRVRESQHAFLV